MEGNRPRPTIPDAKRGRVSRTLDFIPSYPVKGEASELTAGTLEQKRLFTAYRRVDAERQRLFPREGVVFEAGKQGV